MQAQYPFLSTSVVVPFAPNLNYTPQVRSQALARRQGWEQAQDTIVLGDGASWIWNQATLHFGQSHQLVDWYHAKEHLTAAVRLLKPEGAAVHTRRLNGRETVLHQGHADKSAGELVKAATCKGASNPQAFLTSAGYFRANHHRMNYVEMSEEEWPIGSGMIERGARQFKARSAGPGMRWSRNGAENLLPTRAAVLSRRFDPMWLTAKNLSPS